MYFICDCCDKAYNRVSAKQDPELDCGKGRCDSCRPQLIEDMVKCGGPQLQSMTHQQATEYIHRYA